MTKKRNQIYVSIVVPVWAQLDSHVKPDSCVWTQSGSEAFLHNLNQAQWHIQATNQTCSYMCRTWPWSDVGYQSHPICVLQLARSFASSCSTTIIINFCRTLHMPYLELIFLLCRKSAVYFPLQLRATIF
jgi:hypothetical protein